MIGINFAKFEINKINLFFGKIYMMNIHTQQRGFSLPELMIAIAILMILAALSIPSYQSYIQRSRLENARATVVDNIKLMEQHYGQYRTFACTSAAATKTNGFCAGRNSGTPNALQVSGTNPFYSFGIILMNSNNEYLITASPLANVYDSDTLANKQVYLVYHSGSGSYARCTQAGFNNVTAANSTTSAGCETF